MSGEQYASLAFRVTSLETYVIKLQGELEELRKLQQSNKQTMTNSVNSAVQTNASVSPDIQVEETTTEDIQRIIEIPLPVTVLENLQSEASATATHTQDEHPKDNSKSKRGTTRRAAV